MCENSVPFLAKRQSVFMSCVHEPLEDYFPAGDTGGGSQLGIWPLDTTQRPLLQSKTRAHFSIRSFSPGDPSNHHLPANQILANYSPFGGTIGAKLTIKSGRRGASRADLDPSLLFPPADERSRRTASPDVRWLFPNTRPLMTKLKHPTPQLCNASAKKKKKSLTSVKLNLAQWERYPRLLKMRPKGEITLQEQLLIHILFLCFINKL